MADHPVETPLTMILILFAILTLIATCVCFSHTSDHTLPEADDGDPRDVRMLEISMGLLVVTVVLGGVAAFPLHP